MAKNRTRCRRRHSGGVFLGGYAVAIQRCVVIFHHRLQPDHHIIYLVYLVISLFVRHAAVLLFLI